jgi:hypothetical protein
MLTYAQRSTFSKRGDRAIEARVNEATKAVADAKAAEFEAARVESARRNAPVPFTRDELDAARFVRTNIGWHKVRRVNAQSVTVETGYSWTNRYAVSMILEVRP